MKTKYKCVIHLVGGATIETVEKTDIPILNYMVRLYQMYKQDDFCPMVTLDNGHVLVPIKNILYISYGEPMED